MSAVTERRRVIRKRVQGTDYDGGFFEPYGHVHMAEVVAVCDRLTGWGRSHHVVVRYESGLPLGFDYNDAMADLTDAEAAALPRTSDARSWAEAMFWEIQREARPEVAAALTT